MPIDLYGDNFIAGTVTANTSNGFVLDTTLGPAQLVYNGIPVEDFSFDNGTITLNNLRNEHIPPFELEFENRWFTETLYPSVCWSNTDIAKEEQEELDCKELDDFLAAFTVKQGGDIDK